MGVCFTPFVNRLLDLEVRANYLSGHQLSVNVNETTPEGGVDASVRGASGSHFLPTGDSAWQFKRSGFRRKACADDFVKATWAQDFGVNCSRGSPGRGRAFADFVENLGQTHSVRGTGRAIRSGGDG